VLPGNGGGKEALLASDSLAMVGRIRKAFPDASSKCGDDDYIADAEAETHVLGIRIMV